MNAQLHTYHCDSRHWGPDGPETYGPLYVVGCGQTFTAEPEADGTVDCPRCGMWQQSGRIWEIDCAEKGTVRVHLNGDTLELEPVGCSLAGEAPGLYRMT